ncbi:MAG: hypothetical protein M0Q51_15360, partial [Bacteroidales bacterium]|nr:hypothetical protein [Bacteroidales bacterium]
MNSIMNNSTGMLKALARNILIVNASSQDSLLVYFENDYSPETHYQLAFCKLYSGDTAELTDILNGIPVDFSFNTAQWNNHSLYEALFDILIEMQSDSTGIDNTLLLDLTAIADEADVIPGVFARNLLLNNDLISYNESVYLPEN